MTYEEIVGMVQRAFETSADAREIFEHVAIQIDIHGEGAGTFYLEIANRQVCVEPYDYYDRDGRFDVEASTLVAMAKDELSFAEAVEKGLIRMEGNPDKLKLLYKMKRRKKKK